MLVALVAHLQIQAMFNRRQLSVHGNDSSTSAYMDIDSRANSTSRWLKRDYLLICFLCCRALPQPHVRA